MDAPDALYDRPLAAGRHGPLYNAFSYPTKIAAESIALFIACHTQPGARVLDVFGGSGSTGMAALLCERPTPRMLQMASDAGLTPEWGRRDAVVYELSEIGSLLARVMTHSPRPAEFAAAAKRVLASAKSLALDAYTTVDPSGEVGDIRHIIWSDVVRCPQCAATTTYAAARVRYEPLRFADLHRCAECSHSGHPDSWVRETETALDPLTGQTVSRRARVPWRVYGTSKGGNWSRPGTSSDSCSDGSANALPSSAPIAELSWGDLYRSGYHQGITHLHQLYTPRNFQVLAILMQVIESEPEHLHDALRLFVLSYNASHSTLMTRVVLKQNSKDFVLTGAQSGVLYVSGLPVEKNIFRGLQRKLGVFVRSFEMLHGTSGAVDVVTGSSTKLDLPDASVDYVFTDPPFGAYIPYSEINQINELWLGCRTAKEDEAIVSPSQGKGVNEYQSLLTQVFSEMSRVMRPRAEATVVFHSAHASIWQALAAALAGAGLEVAAASILDKTQASFKQVNGHVAVSGDPLLRVRKIGPATTAESATTIEALASSISADSADEPDDTRRNRRLYAKVVGQALVTGVPVTVDARSFYERTTSGGVR